MKKLVVFILCVCSAFLMASCNSEFNYSAYVSELRQTIYEGESQTFLVSLYAEQREDPFIDDGYVGEIKNVVIVKVEFKQGSANDVKALITYGNETHNASLTYNPVSGKSSAIIKVENLPETAGVNVEITSGEICENVTLSSVVFDKTVDYKEAIKSAVNNDKATLDKLFEEGNVTAEIHVRLIRSEDKNYYYIGFVEQSGKTHAYLIDGETANVLAKKTIN